MSTRKIILTITAGVAVSVLSAVVVAKLRAKGIIGPLLQAPPHCHGEAA